MKELRQKNPLALFSLPYCGVLAGWLDETSG